jgi:hypothetical protein
MTHRTSTTAPALSAWQRAVGVQLASAIERGAGAHAPAHDGAAPAADAPLRSRWRVAAGAAAPPSTLQALAREQAGDPAGRARANALMTQCLAHYRTHIRPDDEADDAGVALACFLAACVQAGTGIAATPARWRATLDWVEAWTGEGLDWASVPPAEQADFFARMASLGVAVGEWSVVASRQGEAAMHSARLLAASSLRAQLGLALGPLAATLRSLERPPAAGDPDWGEPELLKAPTTPLKGERL